MPNLNTNLLSALLKNESVDEVFRQELESTLNDLLSIELTEFLQYDRYAVEGHNTGNSRNGFYPRVLHTRFGDLNLRVPRDRIGEFINHTLAPYKRNTDDLETTIIELYKKGITTSEISDIIEKMYGHYYTPQTVSNITKAVEKQVTEFHSRKVSARYACIFCDATYLNVRRDSVAKEALHVILGITPDGEKEVLDYALFPSESAANYQELLEDLKSRGLEQVLLFITDGLKGLKEACCSVFPGARHQSCWTHLSRNVMKYVRARDKAQVMSDLKEVYRSTDAETAMDQLHDFMEKYQSIYPKAVAVLNDLDSLFTFYSFPEQIRRSIYTTNLIEGLNKQLKRGTKRKEQFPNEDSLDRYVCMQYSEYNQRQSSRVHLGFKLAGSELLEMFN